MGQALANMVPLGNTQGGSMGCNEYTLVCRDGELRATLTPLQFRGGGVEEREVRVDHLRVGIVFLHSVSTR